MWTDLDGANEVIAERRLRKTYGIGEKQLQLDELAVQAPPPAAVHGTLLQHGSVVEQVWPYCAHIDDVAMSVLPPTVGVPHVPDSEPGGTTHTRPVQQSLLVVQVSPLIWHIAPQCNAPVESGTHGSPLQHSPENEQLPPGITHAASELQRGMPLLSSTQHSLPEMHPQQSLRTLVVPPWQTTVFV
jgi:hypothetical protein